jgi:hypothetical protein
MKGDAGDGVLKGLRAKEGGVEMLKEREEGTYGKRLTLALDLWLLLSGTWALRQGHIQQSSRVICTVRVGILYDTRCLTFGVRRAAGSWAKQRKKRRAVAKGVGVGVKRQGHWQCMYVCTSRMMRG